MSNRWLMAGLMGLGLGHVGYANVQAKLVHPQIAESARLQLIESLTNIRRNLRPQKRFGYLCWLVPSFKQTTVVELSLAPCDLPLQGAVTVQGEHLSVLTLARPGSPTTPGVKMVAHTPDVLVIRGPSGALTSITLLTDQVVQRVDIQLERMERASPLALRGSVSAIDFADCQAEIVPLLVQNPNIQMDLIKLCERITQNYLSAIRNAMAIYQGHHDGRFPERIDEGEFKRQMAELPNEFLTRTNRVQTLTKGELTGDGKGGWLYSPGSGEIKINLHDLDSTQKPYTSY